MKTFRIDYHDGAGEFIYTAATVEKTYSPLFGDCIAFNDYTVTKDGVIVDKGDGIAVPCNCILT
jgi:hypothetical protein